MQRLAFVLLLSSLPLAAEPKFYPDDPIWEIPEHLPANVAQTRDLSDFYDYFMYTFTQPAEDAVDPETGDIIPAQGVNTLGEVPDNDWFTNRIGHRELTRAELLEGPGDDRPPSREGKWTIVSAKTEGLTPGFNIKDENGRRYLLKFDPRKNPEMASSADFLGSKFFHALGYNTPENYIVYLEEERLAIGEDVTITTPAGIERPMKYEDIEEILDRVPRQPDGSIRALASLFLSGKPLGGFRYHGMRADDPNDIYRHEHRRDLRGLYVFCSWLGHDDSRSINTLDMLAEDEKGRPYVKHHLIDFGSLLGSASEEPNSPRGGHQYLMEFDKAAVQIFTLGIYIPKWFRWDYKDYPSIGRFEWEIYEPDEWVPEYRNPAFSNRLPDDTYWGAKKVMAFSDEDIRTLVEAADYSNPDAREWLITCLIKRRDKIGDVYFRRVLPLDGFAVEGGRLEWEHLGEKYGFFDTPAIAVTWSRFDNRTREHAALPAAGPELPAEVRAGKPGEYFAARLVGDDPEKTVTTYLRKTGEGFEVVGIDRTFPIPKK